MSWVLGFRRDDNRKVGSFTGYVRADESGFQEMEERTEERECRRWVG